MDIRIPECQELFLRELANLGKPTVGVHFDGRPVSSDAADETLNALIEAWTPGRYGAEAVADVLLGDYNPAGRLPVSIALNAGQIPVYYSHERGSSYHAGESIGFQDYADGSHKPRYCFGHGLSYTEFVYESMEIVKKEIDPFESWKIDVTVKKCRKCGWRRGRSIIYERRICINDPFGERTGWFQTGKDQSRRMCKSTV